MPAGSDEVVTTILGFTVSVSVAVLLRAGVDESLT